MEKSEKWNLFVLDFLNDMIYKFMHAYVSMNNISSVCQYTHTYLCVSMWMSVYTLRMQNLYAYAHEYMC